MKLTLKCSYCLALASLVICALGCSDKLTAEPPAEAVQKSIPQKSAQPPFSEAEGYWHQQSGVGFLYPRGWEAPEVRPGSPISSVGVRNKQGDLEVTLYWTAVDTPVDTETIGEVEWSALSPLYGNKLSRPEPIVVRGKPGFKMKIGTGPLGEGAPDLTGVVYVFAVKSGQDWWKIKLRATVDKKDSLAEVEKLLDNYRW